MDIMGTMSSISIGLHEYNVFISFKGEDTRKKFTDHLYSGLHRKQIKVYIDEKSLGKGEEISSTLLQAIQKSKISLIIFSKNYASSSWCLDELVHILKCREENGQIVVPIFYGVDPSHIRKQEGSFARAFVAHQQRFEDRAEKLQEWRAALIRACKISGWDTRDRYESKLVDEIVEYVVSTVRPRATADSEGLVGINRQLKELESLLCFGSPDVRVLGIWGMGGIGKTTLARVVFNRFSSQFEGCCFLKNVRQEFYQHGPAYLERKLSSKLMGEEDIKIVDDKFDWYRISQKKVLIVLDDVDMPELVEHLIGDRNWFGSGSRIIITTRVINVLRYCAVDEIYAVDGLNFDEALELFRLNAFRGRPFISDYDQLSQSVVHYTHGIPLALRVFGSFLNRQYTSDWGSALDELIMNPSNDIYRALIESYDGLFSECKEIFLRIALFYEGRDRDFIERKLGEFNLHPVIGICELIDRCLISMKGDGQIYMHDLIRRMAWGIVRQCPPEWIRAEERFSDISNFVDYKELSLRRPVFGRRCHNCYDYPQKSLPLKINQHNLVELDMPSSKLERFSSEFQDSSSGTTVRLIISYEGQWRETRGCWSFCGKKTKGIIVSKNITYYQLVERLSHSLMVDQSLYDLDMRFLVVSLVPLPPVEIRDDDDVKFLIETSGEGNPGYPLCITLVKKDTGQHVLIDNDHNVVNFLFQWGRRIKILK